MATKRTTLSARWLCGHALHGVGAFDQGCDSIEDLDLHLVVNMKIWKCEISRGYTNPALGLFDAVCLVDRVSTPV